MAYCVRCGEKVEDTAVTCPACGAVIPKTKAPTQGSGHGEYTYESTKTQGSGYMHTGEESPSGGYTYGSTEFQNGEPNTYNTYYDEQTREGYFPESEVKSNKVMAVLCYLGILVFIPILAGNRQSEYLKLHKNQGFILFIIDTFFELLEKNWGWSTGFFSWLTGGMLGVVCDIVRVVMLILWLMGFVYACRGIKNELPGIGRIKIFK